VSKELPILGGLVDAQKRKISYLRVSVTDRCNYRCTYCVPDGGVDHVPRRDLLEFEEITRVVRLMAGMGVRRVRLTGGEPTVRKDVVELVDLIARVPGVDEVAMTTNAHRFATLAEPLARAGLRSVNISLDTLDPGPFAELTVRGKLQQVLDGIEASRAAGLRVSLNTVALQGTNEGQLGAICRYAWERGIVPRFIEHMPMSDAQIYERARHLSADAIRRLLQEEFAAELTPVAPDHRRGPARYWLVEGQPHQRFGIISAMSEHFCDTCNRLRLSATGQLHACLAHDDHMDLRRVLREGGSDEDLLGAIRAALAGKRDGHEFDLAGGGGPRKHMISIGG
jgi:cyclic pyranopterin phosphate synthase